MGPLTNFELEVYTQLFCASDKRRKYLCKTTELLIFVWFFESLNVNSFYFVCITKVTLILEHLIIENQKNSFSLSVFVIMSYRIVTKGPYIKILIINTNIMQYRVSVKHVHKQSHSFKYWYPFDSKWKTQEPHYSVTPPKHPYC